MTAVLQHATRPHSTDPRELAWRNGRHARFRTHSSGLVRTVVKSSNPTKFSVRVIGLERCRLSQIEQVSGTATTAPTIKKVGATAASAKPGGCGRAMRPERGRGRSPRRGARPVSPPRSPLLRARASPAGPRCRPSNAGAVRASAGPRASCGRTRCRGRRGRPCRRDVPLKAVEEADELLVAMTLHVHPRHRAIEDVERGGR